jgi:hypothetical protein
MVEWSSALAINPTFSLGIPFQKSILESEPTKEDRMVKLIAGKHIIYVFFLKAIQ